MALLKLAPLLVLASCYAPDTRDCAVTCARERDCEAGLVCGADHFCARPAIAGSCVHVDGGVARIDARIPVDAAPDAAPDARPTVVLHVHVMGGGMVTWSGGGTCTDDCMYDATLGDATTLAAAPGQNMKQQFDQWTGIPCAGQPATCTFAATTPLDVTAHFMKAGP